MLKIKELMFISMLISSVVVVAQSSTDTVIFKPQKKQQPSYLDACSGQLSDVNCYKDIIKQTDQDYSLKSIKRSDKTYYQGQQIIVDTSDEVACRQVENYIYRGNLNEAKSSIRLNDFCQKNPEPDDRYRIVTVMWETSEEYITPLKLDFLKNADDSLKNDVRNMSLLMAGTVGLLWAGPESVSKWDKNAVRERGFLSEWNWNVTHRPVWDGDAAIFNYVYHPLAGAAYYNIARFKGYSKMDSFKFSILMSTFFWEYGFEALAERPSIQDLFITPIIGSILGEAMFQWAQKIEENGGKVLGSKRIGKIVLFLLNPAGEISKSINKFLGRKFIQNSDTNIVLAKRPSKLDPSIKDTYIGLELRFKFD